jgi:O-antigen ligase
VDWPIIAALSTVVALAVAVLLARWPVGASLGVYAFLLPFDSVLNIGQEGSLHLHLTWFVAAAASAVLLVRGILGRCFVRPPFAVLWPCLIVFWAVMSAGWAINTENSVFRLPVIALFLILYLTAAYIRVTEKELAVIGCLAMLGGCVAAATSLYELSHGQSFLPSHPDLGTGVEEYELSGRGTLIAGDRETNPNTLAATLILPLSLAVGFLLSSGAWLRRFLLMGVVALIAASICATMSRGGLIGAAVVLLVYLWRARARGRLLMPAAAAGTIILTMPDMFFSRIWGAAADRGAGRLDIWGVGLWAFRHYAVLGAGLDCFPDAYNQYSYTAVHFMGFNLAPHNAYLGTAVELGTVGILLLLAVLTAHFLLAAKLRRADSDESSRLRWLAYEAAYWALLACGFFLDLFWEEYFWFALMLLIIGVRVQEARQKQFTS